jgi:hypothetical protein
MVARTIRARQNVLDVEYRWITVSINGLQAKLFREWPPKAPDTEYLC